MSCIEQYQSTKYLTHALNTSPSKAAYSFGKSERFQQPCHRLHRSHSKSYSKEKPKSRSRSKGDIAASRGASINKRNFSPGRKAETSSKKTVENVRNLGRSSQGQNKKSQSKGKSPMVQYKNMSPLPPRKSSKSLNKRRFTNEQKYGRENREKYAYIQNTSHTSYQRSRSKSPSPSPGKNHSNTSPKKPQKNRTYHQKYLAPSSIQRGKDGKYRVITSTIYERSHIQTPEREDCWREKIGPGSYDYQSHESPGKYLSSTEKNAPSYSFSHLPRDCQVEKEETYQRTGSRSRSMTKKDRRVCLTTDLYTPFSEFGTPKK